MTDKLEILATPFDDPNLCRFTMAGVELTSSEIVFRTSPSDDFFIQDLFGLDGLCEVTVDKNYIICKTSDTTPALGKTVEISLGLLTKFRLKFKIFLHTSKVNNLCRVALWKMRILLNLIWKKYRS